MTNPPSVPSLDVEKIKRVDSVEAMLRTHMQMYDWTSAEARAINDFILTVREGVAEDFARALASALPGVGKDAERWRVLTLRVNHVEFRNRFENGTYSLTRADDGGPESDRFVQSRIAKEIDNIIIAESAPFAAARAAQPEETSADA